MASVNLTICLGNLGKDVEVKFTPNGQAVAKLSIATSESWTDKNGDRQQKTEWINCTVWGKNAENCGKFLRKGSQVYVEGSLQTRSYEDKNGEKKYATEVIARRVQFLGGRPQENQGGSGGEQTTFDSFGGDEDPIPFASCSFVDSLSKEFTQKIM